MLIVDADLDLAYNAVGYGRNLMQSVAELRSQEQTSPRGTAITTFPELHQTGISLVFGTLFVMPAASSLANLSPSAVYHDAAGAHEQAMAQLDYYHRIADETDYVQLVGNRADLENVIASHQEEDGSRLLGIVPLMEGADPIRSPEEVEYWYERGLRLIGLAWDDTRYSPGAWRAGGGLTDDGRKLLEVMAEFGFIADITHMSEQASLEALERYSGPIVATHSNARALVPRNRQLSDVQIRSVAERNGVIGVVLFNAFLRANHGSKGAKELVTLDHVVAHIDYICQLLGSADHVGIGSDFDGGFGAESIPAEMDSVADLPLLATRLREKGYAEEHIAQIMGENWLRVLRDAWS